MAQTWTDVGITFRRRANPQGDSKEACPRCQDKDSLSVNRIKETWLCHSSHCNWTGCLKGGEARITYSKPRPLTTFDISDRALAFFAARGIAPEVVLKHKITSFISNFAPDKSKPPLCKYEAVAYPINKYRQLVNVSNRRIHYTAEVEAKTVKRAKWFFVAGCEQPLLNTDNINWNEPIYWVEGWLDGLALESIGIPNWVSLPNGSPQPEHSTVGRLSILDEFMPQLDKCPEHLLYLDNDPNGIHMTQALARRLQQGKCRKLQWPEDNFNIGVTPDTPESKPLKDVGDILEACGPARLAQFLQEASIPYPLGGCATSEEMMHSIMYEPPIKADAKTGIPELDKHLTIQLGYLHICTGVPGLGKALDINTPISTPDGWKLMKDLHVGDRVFDEKGRICNVTMATPIMYNRKCFEVKFSDNVSIVCDADHLWFTRDDKARRSEYRAKLNKRELGGVARGNGVDQSHKRKLAGIKTTTEIAQQITVEGGKRYNHSVPLALPLDLPEISLPLDPYVLGVWLGDGHTDGGRISKPDMEIFDRIEAAGFTVTCKDKEAKGITGLQPILKTIGVFGNKHIPAVYLRASDSQRLRLLQGLMDTDGYVPKGGSCEFSNTNKVLAYQVKELIMSLGFKANLYTGRATLYGKDCGEKYRVYFIPDRKVALLERKAVNISYVPNPTNQWRQIVDCVEVDSVPVKCISVDSDSSLYLAGENFIPTHNSTTLSDFLRRISQRQGWKHAVYSAEDTMKSFMQRVSSQIEGQSFYEMEDETKRSAGRFISDHFTWIKHEEIRTVAQILEIAEGLVRQKDIKSLVIDPWNKLQNERLEKGISEIEYLQWLLNILSSFAKKWMIAIIVVAHPPMLKNARGEVRGVGSYYDIAGGATWANMGDIIWSLDPPKDDRPLGSGMLQSNLTVHKIREKPSLGILGSVNLIFDPRTKRVMSQDEFHALNYKHITGTDISDLDREEGEIE